MKALAFATIERATGGIRRYSARLWENRITGAANADHCLVGSCTAASACGRIVLWQGLSTH